jgi:hypothetical protein
MVLVGRLLLLVTAASAVALAMALARGHDRAATQSSARYACPMHPEATATTPGDCPICGMALERVGEAAPARSAGARIAILAPTRRRVLGGAVRAPAWPSGAGEVTALLHNDDLVGLAPGDRALFFSGAAPAVALSAHLSAAPAVSVDASTCQVRFTVDARAVAMDVGLLQIASHPRELLTVPTSALLYSDDGPYVLVAADDDALAKRHVAIGRILDSSYAAGVSGDNVGAIVILAGLHEGERVVAADAFFWDAERRLRVARGEGHEVAR